jgi:penicillin-insensitive murein endopeptidase
MRRMAGAGSALMEKMQHRLRINHCLGCGKTRSAALLLAISMTALGAAASYAQAQDTAAAEALHRAAVLSTLPPLAAKRVFGRETTPAPGPAQSIGSYARGCIEGAVEMPAGGPTWQVMRPSRNRAWGHPALIAFLENLSARAAREDGWRGLLIGDIGQPRGGPMLTGHASHQLGLDADIWLTPMPDRRLSAADRDSMPAVNLVAPDGLSVDRNAWRPADFKLLETAARSPGVARIFVTAAIKKALCEEAGADRGWLWKIRPWWGHKRHFHVRLDCPAGDPGCHDQAPPPPGDGCGEALAWWFTPEALHPKPPPPRPPVLLSQLPPACTAIARAP